MEKGIGSAAASGSPARRRVFWAVVAGAVVLGAAGFFAWRARSRKPKYVTALVTRGSIQRSVSTTGALNPVVTVQVGSYVSGTLKSLACDYNTEVVVGQRCATIDPVPFQLIVDEDRAQVSTAQAQLKKDQASLSYAKTAYERDAKLVAEGTVSQDTVDSEKSVYDQAVAQIGLDQAAIADKQAALKAAQVNLAYTDIVSPVVGTVITRSIDVGQTVAASLQSPTLFLIGKDLTHMQVDTNVSEADVGEVRLDQNAFFTVQAFPGQTFRGKVTQIRRGPITVQNVVTYDVVIAVPNPDRRLFPGMTADTHIVIDERDDVLRVPLPAVRFTPEGFSALRADARPERSDGAESTGEGQGRPRNRTPGAGDGRPRNRPDGAGGEGRGGEARGGEGHGEGRPRRGRGGASQVWVLDGDELKAVKVMTGIDDGALIEVSGEGLKPGARVVVNQLDANGERRGGTAGNQGQAFRPPGTQGQQPGFQPGPRP
ncbi:MAG TPA: efflux RND transporter periplasmic adaptor subunit [Thermoanaerobaculia bacterium]|nr:efflux RND transporter periplasmic adaptor subunit [Thermoanaerobaculia bacterium]